ncbi:MAG: hypothetical protein AAFY71_07440 [Bacteroidota bacterium]
MKGLLVVLTLGLFLLFKPVSACSCIDNISLKDVLATSELIVIGEILSKERVQVLDSAFYDPNTGFDPSQAHLYTLFLTHYQVEVKEVLFGKISSTILSIYTGVGGGDCGLQLKRGTNTVLYLNPKSYMWNRSDHVTFPAGPEVYWTNICKHLMVIEELNIKWLRKYQRKLTAQGEN